MIGTRIQYRNQILLLIILFYRINSEEAEVTPVIEAFTTSSAGKHTVKIQKLFF